MNTKVSEWRATAYALLEKRFKDKGDIYLKIHPEGLYFSWIVHTKYHHATRGILYLTKRGEYGLLIIAEYNPFSGWKSSVRYLSGSFLPTIA